MEIVIEIPRKTYEHIRAEGGHGIFNPWMGDDNEIVTKAIFNGTPLPEHHGRIIDESKINTVFHNTEEVIYNNIKAINTTITHTDAPTIIEGSDSE